MKAQTAGFKKLGADRLMAFAREFREALLKDIDGQIAHIGGASSQNPRYQELARVREVIASLE